MEKICASCQKSFHVRDEDLDFLRKNFPTFAGKFFEMPLPQHCPVCREQRRLAYRNERFLYRRKSDLSGKEMISFFAPDSKFVVYTKEEWWSDSWDATHFSASFDFTKPFFEQFYAQSLRIPRVPLVNNKSENAEYCNFADNNKNSYLLTSADDNEDCYFGSLMAKNRSAIDSLWVLDCELTYECVECTNCYNLRFSQNCDHCSDSSFLLNCRSVRNSILCVNLRNVEYHIMNKPVSKEEYQKVMKEISGSYSKYQEMLQRFNALKRDFPIRKENNNVNAEQAVGDNIVNSKNIYVGFDVYDSRDGAYLMEGLRASDCYDIGYFDKTQWCYECNSVIGYGMRFTNFCKDGGELWYSDNCHACRNCFGCIGLRNKEYCIFNKQFLKAEYEELVARIISHMQKTGEWGEFFPMQNSLFPYNETVAQEFYPLDENEALQRRLPWRTAKSAEHVSQKVKLPDNIRDTKDSVCQEILQCEVTGKNFKIIPQELAFYRKTELPLPRKSPDQRHAERLALRNPRVLWKRPCQKCAAEIETTYAPHRPEVVYCEKCYLTEVY